jgi:SAM-dependent methyltransferase
MAGAYAGITYGSRNWLVRTIHLRRFDNIRELSQLRRASSWLDYGAGDGKLIAMVQPTGRTVAYEPVEHMREACAEQLDGLDVDVVDQVPDGPFDVVTALEVLEHLPLPERRRFYDVVRANGAARVRCIVEVPVEYGPVLVAKALGRQFIKRRPREYGTTELLRAGLLGRVADTSNRFDERDTRTWIGAHKGFDVRRLRAELRQLGTVVEVRRSPFRFLPAWLNQCVIFVVDVESEESGSGHQC